MMHSSLKRRAVGVLGTVAIAGESGDISKCPFASASVQTKKIMDVISTYCSSTIEVGAFVLVFGPFLLPLAFFANLRIVLICALVFVQLHLQIPRFKLAALGIAGNAVFALRLLKSRVARHLAFLKHPISVALIFLPALLLFLFKGDRTSRSRRLGSTAPLLAKDQISQILADAEKQVSDAEIMGV
eukprot:CAMPEP_0179422176 /NCGR_PEP_ID=MMETSP0799-20121207/10267_1 /TAXON_ID=46947 /ORGANISM="Geminigera cryophila, Strain CCMP2564" /LENGTH=185 /DNA_ID=CAMNT_0021196247 /DNA_START=189 /DNA_END=746 /DNA_ORIENTATION=+